MDLVKRYIKLISSTQDQAFTFWCQYIFLASFFTSLLKSESFLLSVIVVCCWYSLVIYDFIKAGKLFNCMYILNPGYDKVTIHICDIIIHIGPLLINVLRVKQITFIDILNTWMYCRLWSLIQSHGTTFYYIKVNDPIYLTYCIYGWYLFYFIETFILFITLNNLRIFNFY